LDLVICCLFPDNLYFYALNNPYNQMYLKSFSARTALYLALSSLVLLGACNRTGFDGDPTVNVNEPAYTYKNDVATKWFDLQLQLIKNTPGFSPPVASRALGYTGITLYQSVIYGMPENASIGEVLKTSISLPGITGYDKYNWAIVANTALYNITKKLYNNTPATNMARLDSLHDALKAELGTEDRPQTISRSMAYGQSLAESIYAWSVQDGGHDGQSRNFPASYTPPAGPGLWVPTSAANPIPLQPYWGNNRPFLANNVTGSCILPPHTPFSTNPALSFYQQAAEVYAVGQNLTATQSAIALFWADGGGSITPPGHNINLATQMIRARNLNLAKTAEVYLKMGMAVSDAFVACWKGKYTYNLMRPVSYINQYIDPAWTPLIATPPFPAYGSGHATVSGAGAEILASFFGNSVTFTDRTHEGSSLGTRSFTSFLQAADEAAISRLYGGIHYRMDNEQALLCGREIGRNIAALNLKR
jgi:membrane-associated phospholipid phosphatase